MQRQPSRRSVLASAGTLALTGLAGCTTGGSESETTSTVTDTTTGATTRSTDSETPDVDWSSVADFRTWLTDYSTLPSSNARFDYQEVGFEQLVGAGRTSVFDIATEDVEGVLLQSANVFVLGDFDAEARVADLEADESHEVTGEHEGYTTAEATETGTEFAVGGDAVLAGSDLTPYIDTHLGNRERLEESAPVFTRLLERLPDRGLITGQFGPPTGGEIDADAIEAWGHSLPSVDAADGTWVYALEPGTSGDSVDELEGELAASAFTKDVTDRVVDGRFVTFTASMAEL